jgi:riboflavin kinase/FMN adenylyltransferase
LAGSAVTVGVFDGVHRGHKAILDLLIGEADRRGLRTIALTFDPHPDQVVRSKAVPLLSTIEERVELLRLCGAQEVKVLKFDGRLRETPHEVFVQDTLVGGLGCRLLVVGPSFALGKGRAGTAQALKDLGGRLGFEFRQADPVVVGGRTVSSSWIREEIGAGRIELAAELLGRPYRLRGRVVTGAGRGRKIGFPTANVGLPPGKLAPGPGTYAGAVSVRGERRPAAVNIGFRPTFRDAPERGLTIEAHILDFSGQIAGEPIELVMLARLRDERHFGEPSALARQIEQDVTDVRRIVGPQYLQRDSDLWRGR